MELGDIWGGSGFMDYSVMWIVSRFLVKVGALVCGLYKGANGLGDGAGRGCCCCCCCSCCCCCQYTCTFLICLWNILDHTYTSYYFGSRTNVIGKGLLLRMAFTKKTCGICFLHRRYRHVFFFQIEKIRFHGIAVVAASSSQPNFKQGYQVTTL